MSVFTLDISRLAGSEIALLETPLQERGQTIQIEWVQAGADQNIILHGYAVRGVPGEALEQDFPIPQVSSTGSLSYYGSGLYGSGLYGIGGTGSGLFILDLSTLGGSPNASSFHVPLQERGRTIQIEWIQAGGNQDMRIHGYAVRGVPAEVHSMESS